MNDRISKLIHLQTIKKRFEPENTDEPLPTFSDRIDALEDAVLALSSAVPEAAANMEKLYGNLVKLDKIDSADVPQQVKPGLKDGLNPTTPRKEATQ